MGYQGAMSTDTGDAVSQRANALHNPPAVSVGMPVYNAETAIRAAVDSILAQTFRDFELIIVDNASTDGTRRICEEYARKDDRIRYVLNPRNLGACENYNQAFRHARGKFFKWASGNDTCHPELLGRCLEVLTRQDNVVLAHPLTKIIDEQGRVQELRDELDLRQADPAARFRALLKRVRLNNMLNGVFRSDVLRNTPLHRSYFGSDVSLMAEVALHGQIAEVPEYLFFRRMDRNSATKLRNEAELAEFYNPQGRGMPLFSLWRFFGHLAGAIWRAPVPVSSKWALYSYVVRSMIWKRHHLQAEIRAGSRWLLS
jgi:glycosyltransferase involved in cell wall biosynthesis